MIDTLRSGKITALVLDAPFVQYQVGWGHTYPSRVGDAKSHKQHAMLLWALDAPFVQFQVGRGHTYPSRLGNLGS
jgi:hypothetical protein